MSQLSSEQVNAPVEQAAARISREAVETLSRQKAEPPALLRRRLAAWETYAQIPMPTNRDEEWRRTDIRPLKLDQVEPLSDEAEAVASLDRLPAELHAVLADEGGRAGLLVQRNGSVVYRELDPDLAARGVLLMDLEQAARQHPDIFERCFMAEAVRPGDEKFAALHAAFWTGGALLYVPRGVRIELPIQSVFWGDSSAALFPHTLVVAEPESEVTYVEQYASPDGTADGQSFASGVVEILARPGARVQHVGLQEWGRDVWSFVSQRAVVERDATVDSLVVAFGGRLSKARVQTALRGPGARSKMLGLLFGADRQHFDFHTLQDHVAPSTTSELLYKGALKDAARSVFSGLIKARREAQKTDAVQTNRNLLLSDRCRADSIPNLEIEANDLRCTHAAAVAPVDEEQLFYLQARGLSRPEATRLIVEGFFEPLLEQIPLPGIRERVRAMVAAKVESEK